jgi:serine/threonine protein kinase/tetratricopeptide (TPR) repeat protein
MVGSSIGPYLVVEKLGAGGMGEVFLAFDTRLNRKVALKSLAELSHDAPDTRDRLMREARAAAGLSHPNIAAIHDIIESGSRPCIVMEYVQGESLAARVRRGPVPCAQALSIGIQIADGLAHAHGAGVVHRDLKPANVLVTKEGVAKILDFGLAKTADFDPSGHSPDDVTREGMVSRVGTVSGTPAYMSPEQLMGRPGTAQSDIYSLGVLLFELLTGRRPYDAPDLAGLALAVVSEPTPTAEAVDPSVPSDLSAAVARAMAKDPRARHASALELAAELRRVDRELGAAATIDRTASTPSTRPFSGPVVASPARRRLPILLGGAAVIVALVVLGFAIRLNRYPPPQTAPGDARIIGVLPLSNLTGDPSRDYVGVGISESVLTSLAALPSVTVISGNDTGKYLTRREDTRTIARNLGATVLLAGSVLQATDVLSFSVKLLSADGTVLWAAQYEAPREALLQLQARVATEVAGALNVSPTAAEHRRISTPPSSSVDAYAEFAKGRTLMNRSDVRENLDEAIACFERATEKDPRFALAHAALGDALWAKYEDTFQPELAARALATIEQGRTLDPSSARIQVSLANVQLGTGRLQEGAATLQQAIAERPNDDESHRLLARALARQGNPDGAVREYQRAITIRPDYFLNHSALGNFYFRAGRYAEAAMAYQRVTEVQPDSALGYLNLGAAYAAAGDKARALQNFQHALAIQPDEMAQSNVGAILYSERRYAEAAAAFEQAVRLGPRSPVAHRNLGDASAKLGNRAQARAEYRKALELSRELLKVNPRDIQELSRCAVYLAKLGESAEALKLASEAVAAGGSSVEVIYKRAVVHALLGQQDEAVRWLERAVGQGYSRAFAREDDDLSSIATLPKVRELLREPR